MTTKKAVGRPSEGRKRVIVQMTTGVVNKLDALAIAEKKSRGKVIERILIALYPEIDNELRAMKSSKVIGNAEK